MLMVARNPGLIRRAVGISAALNVADIFSTDLWTGNGSARSIVNGLDLNDGMVWIKRRETTFGHRLFDTHRGALEYLDSSETSASASLINSLTSFNSDGFSLGSASAVNLNSGSFVSWSFKKNTRFFDVVTYTGNGTAGRTVAHNLGVVPGMIIVKCYSHDSLGWAVYHRGVAADPWTDFLETHSIAGAVDLNTVWNDTAPTDAEFTVGTLSPVNTNGNLYIAYIFAHDPEPDGVVQCGSYTGNGSVTGPTIDLGWEPQWVLIKRTNASGNWRMYDNVRDTSNPISTSLQPNTANAEDTSGENINFLSDGFEPKSSAADINGGGNNYIYMAIRAE